MKEEKEPDKKLAKSIEENGSHEDVREVPPSPPPEAVGVPKKTQIQDLLPVLGKYKIEDIAGNKEAIGMIVQLLLDKTVEVDGLKNEIEKINIELREKSDEYIGEKTKLAERWKSHLLIQLLTFVSALAISFAFQFKKEDMQFLLFLIVGVISGLFAIIMPFVVNLSGSKNK